MEDSRAIRPLIQALQEDGDMVRRFAAKALGDLGDVRAVETLTQALKDENTVVRQCATRALGDMENRRLCGHS